MLLDVAAGRFFHQICVESWILSKRTWTQPKIDNSWEWTENLTGWIATSERLINCLKPAFREWERESVTQERMTWPISWILVCKWQGARCESSWEDTRPFPTLGRISAGAHSLSETLSSQVCLGSLPPASSTLLGQAWWPKCRHSPCSCHLVVWQIWSITCLGMELVEDPQPSQPDCRWAYAEKISFLADHLKHWKLHE